MHTIRHFHRMRVNIPQISSLHTVMYDIILIIYSNENLNFLLLTL
jgi:hypothetical protein